MRGPEGADFFAIYLLKYSYVDIGHRKEIVHLDDLYQMDIWVIYDVIRDFKGQNEEFLTASILRMMNILKSITEQKLFRMMLRASCTFHFFVTCSH